MHKLWSKAQFLILLWIPAKVLTQLKAAKLTISVNFPMRINFLQWKCCPFVIEKTIWNKMQKICLCFKSQSNLQVESSVKSPCSPDFYNLHILCSLSSSKMEINMWWYAQLFISRYVQVWSQPDDGKSVSNPCGELPSSLLHRRRLVHLQYLDRSCFLWNQSASSPAGKCRCALGGFLWSSTSAVRPGLSGSIWINNNNKLCRFLSPWGDDEVVRRGLLDSRGNDGWSSWGLAVSLANGRPHTRRLWHVWNRFVHCIFMPFYFNSKLYRTTPRRSSRNWRWLHITSWAQLSNWSTCSIFFVLPHLSSETTTLSVISAVSKTTACIGLQISSPKLATTTTTARRFGTNSELILRRRKMCGRRINSQSLEDTQVEYTSH